MLSRCVGLIGQNNANVYPVLIFYFKFP